jgi:hypothetical protein
MKHQKLTLASLATTALSIVLMSSPALATTVYETEPNDNASEADVLPRIDSFRTHRAHGDIGYNGDRFDMYSVEITQKHRLTVSIGSVQNGADILVSIYHDANNDNNFTNDEFVSSFNSNDTGSTTGDTFDGMNSGRYFIYLYRSSGFSDYILSVTANTSVQSKTEYEPNDNLKVASHLTGYIIGKRFASGFINGGPSGQIDTEDFFSIDMSGRDLGVTIKGMQPNGHVLLYKDINNNARLEQGVDQYITFASDTSSGEKRISTRLPSSGRYLLTPIANNNSGPHVYDIEVENRR